jgi:hypothetical protein
MVGSDEVSDFSFEPKDILSRGKMLTEDTTEEAIKVRDESRILQGAFAYNVMVLLGMAMDGRVSQVNYFEVIRRVFTLGYLAAKQRETIRLQDIASSDKIGNLNDEFDDVQLEFCFRIFLVMEEHLLKKEASNFLSKHRIAEDILKVLSQELIDIDVAEDNQGAFASRCASAFVLGYVAAKYPNRFKNC